MRRRTVNSPAKKNQKPKHIPVQSFEDFSKNDIHKLADDLLTWYDAEPDEPLLRTFFNSRNISNETVRQMYQSDEYFAAVYDVAMAKQEERIVKWGLKTKNAMPIFLLKALHRYSDNPQPEDDSTVNLIDNFPSEEETEQARAALKDDRMRDAMLDILRQEEREKLFRKPQEGKK